MPDILRVGKSGMSQLLVLVLVIGGVGCGGGDSPESKSGDDTAAVLESPADNGDGGASASGRIEGEIVETVTSGRYTYVLVRTAE